MRAGSGVVVYIQRGVQLRSEDDVAGEHDHSEPKPEKAPVGEVSKKPPRTLAQCGRGGKAEKPEGL